MLVCRFRGWASVKAIAIVSLPLLAYFTYGRCPRMEITVRARLQVPAPVSFVDSVGFMFPPRQNR
jgi:hypothetical protein